MMPFDLTAVVPKYEDAMDSMLDQMGKHVILHFADTVTNVTSVFDDIVREEDSKKPAYKDISANAPVVIKNSKTITALVHHNPKDFQTFDLRLENTQGVVRLRTYLKDVSDLLRCIYITTDSDTQPLLALDYKLVREPIPIGLQQNRYAVSFWQRI